MIYTINGKEALPVGRPDFKPGVGRLRSCVGSTPTPFRPSSQTPTSQVRYIENYCQSTVLRLENSLDD